MRYFLRPLLLFIPVVLLTTQGSQAQFTYRWLDAGALRSAYSEIGALPEAQMNQNGMQWPAHLQGSNSSRARAFWLGVKDWTDESGTFHPYSVSRVGPTGFNFGDPITPVSRQLVSKWNRTSITLNTLPNDGKYAFNMPDAIDPALPADQMLHHVFRTREGVEVDQKIYAFSNIYHEDYHLIVRTFTNTGNTDADDEIELPGQTLNEMMVFNAWRWTGRSQAAWSSSNAQVWGKFNMIDVVGDGYQDYPVDFTAIYSWAGFDSNFTKPWIGIGGPMLASNSWTQQDDTTGRLAGMSMQGLVVLHADSAPDDPTYDPALQPHTLGFMEADSPLTRDGQTGEQYYEEGILTTENPNLVPGGSSRMFPHYADRIEPGGVFWAPTTDASNNTQGGHMSTIAYGPYTLGPGESITIAEAIASNGLDFAAADAIGRAFKASGLNENQNIPYDANGDGTINTTPFDYSTYDNGTEWQTKNQWTLSARDSLWKTMHLARAAWEASAGMTQYPILEAPAPPASLDLTTFNDRIELRWEKQEGHANPLAWEIYRTSRNVEREPYERIATLPGSARTYFDTSPLVDVDYFYYLQAVGPSNAVDPNGITGTPSGEPLRSSRYLAQTRLDAFLFEPEEIPPYLTLLETNEFELGDSFASSLSIWGNTAAISATGSDLDGHNTGTAYIFEKEGGTWRQTARIRPDDLQENRSFGSPIELQNDRLVIGSSRDNENGDFAGAVYVFERQSGGSWTQTAKITAEDGQERDSFGTRISLHQDRLMVAATGKDDRGENAGAVYIYDLNEEGIWAETGRLWPGAQVQTPGFGAALESNEDFAFVSPATADSIEGAVYVFKRQADGTWLQNAILKAEDGEETDRFGRRLRLSGPNLFITAEEDQHSSTSAKGSVYAFRYQDNDTWIQENKITLRTSTGGSFGVVGRLAVDYDRALIYHSGGFDNFSRTPVPAGVYVYQRYIDRGWVPLTKLEAYNRYGKLYGFFGNAVSLHRNQALIGLDAISNAPGLGYVFDMNRITATSTEDDAALPPEAFSLEQNYPNPFNHTTTITFSIPRPSDVRLVLFDLLGKEIGTLVDQPYPAGTFQIDANAGPFASGTYFYQLQAGDKRITKSMIVVR